MNYLKNHIQACYYRTLPCIDFDNGGKRTEGMSWGKSIYLMFYYLIKKLIK